MLPDVEADIGGSCINAVLQNFAKEGLPPILIFALGLGEEALR
jgi:hypothetical protein